MRKNRRKKRVWGEQNVGPWRGQIHGAGWGGSSRFLPLTLDSGRENLSSSAQDGVVVPQNKHWGDNGERRS